MSFLGAGEEGPHFGGFEEEQDEEKQKTKAEVMREVIAKSKQAKHERQQNKLADEELRQELDDELGDIRGLLFSSSDAATDKAKEVEESRPPLISSNKGKIDAYDSAVRALAFERRAKPQDRLKTESEKAEELANKLQQAERNRLKRMRGEDMSDDDSEKRQRKTTSGGDDLEDDFELDGMTSEQVYGLGPGLATEADDSEDDQEDEEDEEDEEEEDENGSDSEDDFNDLADIDNLQELGEDVEHENDDRTTTANSHGGKTKPSSKGIPFTFTCPDSLDTFLETINANDIPLADIPLVVKRIRTLHHPSLAEENKFKLQTLIAVLLDYILYISSQITEDNTAATLSTIDALVPQVFTLTKAYPLSSSEHFINKLILMQKNLTRGVAKGPQTPEARTWPGVAECILLRITGLIWPTSDRSHPVTTPMSLLIGQYLSASRIRTLQDIARGLMLCSFVVEHERQSSRLVPEALNFLHNCASLLSPISSKKELKYLNNEFGIPWPDFEQEQTKTLRITEEECLSDVEPSLLGFVEFIGSNPDPSTQAKVSLLSATMTLQDKFSRLYMGSTAYVELFRPFEVLWTTVIGSLPGSLQVQKQALISTLHRLNGNAHRQRRALRLQAHRAIPLASHVPKFDQGFDPARKGGRTFDPDAQRAEQAKLRALVKKERKGAVRELRRDNEFLAEARRKAREEEDQRYAKSIDKIMGSLSAERGEEKAYLRDKQRLKRRAGKK